MKSTITSLVVLLAGGCALPSFAQPTFDSSGNSRLNGSYYMRQVLFIVSDSAGDIGEAINIQGEITFNGSGTYSFTGNILDCTASPCPSPVPLTNTGTYVISASGEGYISAIDSNFSTDQIIGLLSAHQLDARHQCHI
jgi:hypothetical protein